jgi:hypothetical protein
MSLHAKISYVKSFVRIIAAILLINKSFIVSGVLFLIAEIIGIIEEIYE